MGAWVGVWVRVWVGVWVWGGALKWAVQQGDVCCVSTRASRRAALWGLKERTGWMDGCSHLVDCHHHLPPGLGRVRVDLGGAMVVAPRHWPSNIV